MKKTTIGIITTAIFLFAYFCSIFLSYSFIDNKWVAFSIGGVFLLINIALTIILSIKKMHISKSLAIPLLALNGIGSGLMVVAIMLAGNFIYEQIELLQNIGICMLICLATYLVYFVLIGIPVFEKHIKLYTILFYVVMLALFFILLKLTDYWLFTGIAYFLMSFMIFSLIIPTENESEAWSNFYYSSIGAFAVVSIIALMALAGDGDVSLEFDDLIPDIPENPNKKKYNK